MSFWRAEFKKDVVVLLLITILLSSVLALVIGYISDYYFGDAVNSLIGDYENNDLLLIIDQQRKKGAIKRIREVVKDKLAGSKVISGITLAGRSNLFISLADKYKTRNVFLKLEDYFKGIEGVTTTSIMTEPRLTINGLKNKTRELLAEKINKLDNVAFSFPDGDKLEVIITEAQFRAKVKTEINDILEDYQALGIRFPISNELDNLFLLGEEITAAVKDDFSGTAYNVTESTSSDMDSLVKTMTEMKKFLASYATEVKVELFKETEVKVGDKLVIPAKSEEEIYLRVSSVNDMIATAVITAGDSKMILDNLAYNLNSNNSQSAIGKVKINNPRHKLAYLVTELNKLVPQLNYIFSDASDLIINLEEVFSTLEILNDTTGQIMLLNNRLLAYKQDLAEVEISELKKDLSALEQSLNHLVMVIERLEFLRDLILDLEEKLATFKSEVSTTKQEFVPQSNYHNNLTELEDNINNLRVKLKTNTGKIINYINRYNPLLIKIKDWQKKVKDFNGVIDKLINEPQINLETYLKEIIKPDLVTQINNLREAELEQELEVIKEQLESIKRIDFVGITKELEYIQRSLPKLRDEEITSSIDLLDRYLAGKVIPGGEISLLLTTANIDLPKIKAKINALLQQQITFYTSPPGVIVPNLRSQIYQILSEVKIILIAITAIICTVLSLLFDHGLIISSLQELNSDTKWYYNIAFYYSLAVGGITLGSIIYLTGFSSPYFPNWGFLLFGSGLGLLMFKEAKTITAISSSEFRAGEALGFSYAQIMRQIIIPAGKPGLLKFLNRYKTYF